MSLVSKSIVILALAGGFAPLTQPAQALEVNQRPPLVAQNNPYNNVDDGFHSLIMDTLRMIDTAKAAMKSNDPEIKRMAQETYNMGVERLHSMMSMWMKANPIRSTSPRP